VLVVFGIPPGIIGIAVRCRGLIGRGAAPLRTLHEHETWDCCLRAEDCWFPAFGDRRMMGVLVRLGSGRQKLQAQICRDTAIV